MAEREVCTGQKIVYCKNCHAAYCFGCQTNCPRCHWDVPLTSEEYRVAGLPAGKPAICEHDSKFNFDDDESEDGSFYRRTYCFRCNKLLRSRYYELVNDFDELTQKERG